MKNGFLDYVIKEEIYSFIKEYYEEREPSLADKWYEKKLGIGRETAIGEHDPSDGEFIGQITKNIFGNPFYKPSNVYKNPKSLKNYPYDARGILLENGDFYIKQRNVGIHEDLIQFLIEKNVLPRSTERNYANAEPKEYIAVYRDGYSNIFIPSTLYYGMPDYYLKIFDLANKKHKSFFFDISGYQHEVDEQLDMNRSYSYHPKDLDPNRNFGRGF